MDDDDNDNPLSDLIKDWLEEDEVQSVRSKLRRKNKHHKKGELAQLNNLFRGKQLTFSLGAKQNNATERTPTYAEYMKLYKNLSPRDNPLVKQNRLPSTNKESVGTQTLEESKRNARNRARAESNWFAAKRPKSMNQCAVFKNQLSENSDNLRSQIQKQTTQCQNIAKERMKVVKAIEAFRKSMLQVIDSLAEE